MALVLVAALQGLAASGHFPRAAKTVRLPVPDRRCLFGSIDRGGGRRYCAGIVAALRFVSWTRRSSAAELAVLVAPLVLQALPDRFVDGRGALIAFAAANGRSRALLVWLAIGIR